MGSKRSIGIDDFIKKDLVKLGKETEEKKAPDLVMYRYLVSPRTFTQSFDKKKPNRIDPVEEYVTKNDCYNLVYVLFNNKKQIWAMNFIVESQETVDILRANKYGRIELICTDNYRTIVHLKDDHEKVKELAKIKMKYKKPIPFHHLELNYQEGMERFIGSEVGLAGF